MPEPQEMNFLAALVENLRPKQGDVLPAALSGLANLIDIPQDLLSAGVGAAFGLGNNPQESFNSRFARGQDPSELAGLPSGFESPAALLGLGIDVVADPLNFVGVGAFTKGKKLGRAALEAAQAGTVRLGQ